MRCKDFLALHSDFRDGTITDPSMERRMRRHQARCRSCSKYAEALEVGTNVLRQMDVEPSARFRVNLRVRMALANRKQRNTPYMFGWPARAAATALVVTGVLAGFAQRKDAGQADGVTQVVSSVAGDAEAPARPRPVSAPEFPPLPVFHQAGANNRPAEPRVVFSMSEDSGFRAVPATFTR